MKRLLSFLALTASAHAHHGQDFFLTLDPRVPGAGAGSVFMTGSWAKTSGAEESHIDPGFLLGVGGGFALGSTFTFANGTPGDFGYAGVTPILQWSTPVIGPDLRFGVSASYHFADGSHDSSGPLGHRHAPVIIDPNGPGSNPDAPGPGEGGGLHIHGAGGHSHDGIHRHGEDHFQTRLIAEWEAARDTRVLLNLIAVGGGSDDIDFGYAVAVRQGLTPKWAAGLEVSGDFDTSGIHQAVAGIYYTPVHDLTLRLGAGTGFGPGSVDASVQGGMTWRF